MLEGQAMGVHLIASTAIEMATSRRHAPTPLSAITARRMGTKQCHAQPRRV
jgi:hypothetical protein